MLLRRAAGLKAHRGRGMNNRTPLEVFEEENPVANRRNVVRTRNQAIILI